MQDVVCMYTSILRKYTETVCNSWACPASYWGGALPEYIFVYKTFICVFPSIIVQ